MAIAAEETARRTRERGVAVTPQEIRDYLGELAARGRGGETVQMYRNRLLALYEFLPPDKRVDRAALEAWRNSLLERGYSPGTVNTHLSAANGLLDYLDRRDLQLTGRLSVHPEAQPELTRAEYLRMLSAARVLGRERAYLLVKVFALTGLRVGELPDLTAEAVAAGRVRHTSGGETGQVLIPACLRRELADYLARQGIRAGPVFRSRTGRPLRRTQVTAEIQTLSWDARVDRRTGNPRCLRNLYQAAWHRIAQELRALAETSYERMLDAEQSAVGWEDRPAPAPDHGSTHTEGDCE